MGVTVRRADRANHVSSHDVAGAPSTRPHGLMWLWGPAYVVSWLAVAGIVALNVALIWLTIAT
jgi:hypothetical protein